MLSLKYEKLFRISSFSTKLGVITAIADEGFLYVLEFADKSDLKQKIEKLKFTIKAEVISGETDPIRFLQDELHYYFEGTLKDFKTPVYLFGSDFQKVVWKELQNIPYGTTRSYCEQAYLIENPKAYRAVANANAANPISIIVPCHRVIQKNGCLGGYSGGVTRKKWLLDHEKNF
jgi:AraC family transcriptional regulator of adaptative response/methylated-DNA-[protein]-cysteine methyltransferase